MKRYYAHDFLIGGPILVDRKQNTLTYYSCDIFGRLYDLERAKSVKVTKQKIQGLLRRLNNPRYSDRTGLAIDRYIYTYLLADGQRAACGHSFYMRISDTLIAAGDSLRDVVWSMCRWAFENKYQGAPEEKEAEWGRLTQYYNAYLNRLAP